VNNVVIGAVPWIFQRPWGGCIQRRGATESTCKRNRCPMSQSSYRLNFHNAPD